MPFDNSVEWVLTHAEEARNLIVRQREALRAMSDAMRVETLPVAAPKAPWWRFWR